MMRRGPALQGHWNWFLAAALLIGGVAALPLLQPAGLLNTRGGGDSPFLLQRVQQLTAALAAGHFPVRWMPDANYGYGYPFFHYYAPLSIYIAALFRLLGTAYTAAIQLAQVAGFLLAAAGSYYLARRWLSDEWGALLASAAYTLAPFHLVNVYVRGDSLAEFWAMALYPWVLLAMAHLLAAETRRARLHAAAALALAYGALVLSHNISALIVSPFFALFGLAGLPVQPQRGRRLLWLALGAGWGLLLAAWFWLPAIIDRNDVQLGPVTEGYFAYANHFRGQNLVQWRVLFDYGVSAAGVSAAGTVDPFRMGLVQALLLVAGVAATLCLLRAARGMQRAMLLALLGALALATLMITPLSAPVWRTLPLLAFTQFPWRFLSIQALAGALVTGALVAAVHVHARPLLTGAVLLLLLAAGLGALRPDYLALRDVDVNARRLAEYEWFSGNIGTTISAEYLPTYVQPRPYASRWLNGQPRWQATVLAGSASAQRSDAAAGGLRQRWRVVVSSETAMLMLPTLYWDGWRAATDGAAVALTPADGSGLITLTLPAGTHDLTLWLGRTPLRAATEGLALLALAALLIVGARPLWSARRQLGAALLALLLLALAARLWPARAAERALQTWDFAEMAYLHSDPAGVAFGGEGRLLAAAVEQSDVAAGASLAVELTWQGPPVTATLALVTPAVHRAQPGAPAVVIAPVGVLLRPGTQTVVLDLPPAMPGGLYLPRLLLSGSTPQTPAGRPRGDLFLPPVTVRGVAAGAPGPDGLNVSARAVVPQPGAPQTGDTLAVQLVWQTDAPLTTNYQATLRLFDARNLFYAEFDGQPGYGFQPALGWPAGEGVNDWYTLRWLAADGEPPYVLVASLYDPADDTLVLRRRLGLLEAGPAGLTFAPHQPQYTLPESLVPLNARFGDAIALRGYTLARAGDQLTATLYWQSAAPLTEDYTHFVHLVGADGRPLAQHDMMPQFSTYPTTQWTAGEIVADPAPLDLSALPAGRYRLQVGLYLRVGDQFLRLPVGAPGDQADVLRLPDEIEIGR